jgi:hypothetical protein
MYKQLMRFLSLVASALCQETAPIAHFCQPVVAKIALFLKRKAQFWGRNSAQSGQPKPCGTTLATAPSESPNGNKFNLRQTDIVNKQKLFSNVFWSLFHKEQRNSGTKKNAVDTVFLNVYPDKTVAARP